MYNVTSASSLSLETRPIILEHVEPLHSTTVLTPLAGGKRTCRVAVSRWRADDPAREPEAALTITRVLDACKRVTDVLTIVDALGD